MDVRDYEYIVAIAEQGSISRAAGQLFISQSALTKYLQRKEREIGLSLFLRKGNQFFLTEAGKRYVETGRSILRLDRTLTEHLAQELNAQKSQIRLGFSMGWTDYILKNVLPAFCRQHPDIMVYLKADTSRNQMAALQNNDQDMVLVTNVEHLPGFCYIPVKHARLLLAVPEDSPLAEKGRLEEGSPYPAIDRKLLDGVPFVALSAATNSGRMAREVLARYDIHPRVTLETSDVRSTLDAVSYGWGVSLIMSVPVGGHRIRYLSLRGVEVPEQTMMLVYRQDKNLSAPMKHLIEILKELD